jgi:hypothetical protein
VQSNQFNSINPNATVSKSTSMAQQGTMDSRLLPSSAGAPAGKRSSDNSRAPKLTQQDKIRWLRNNLPVVIQPVCDIRNGYPLVCIFVCFEEVQDMELAKGPYRVHLKLVYEVIHSGVSTWFLTNLCKG